MSNHDTTPYAAAIEMSEPAATINTILPSPVLIPLTESPKTETQGRKTPTITATALIRAAFLAPVWLWNDSFTGQPFRRGKSSVP